MVRVPSLSPAEWGDDVESFWRRPSRRSPPSRADRRATSSVVR
jgi:hypothetical protein